MTWARWFEAILKRILGFEPLRIKRSPRFIPTWYGARNGRAHVSSAAEGLTPDERKALETVEREQRILIASLRNALRRMGGS